MQSSINFLKDIFSKQCETGDFVFLSVKGPQVPWKDISIKYNSKTISKKLKEVFTNYPASKYDLYFSPMSYSEPRRKAYNVNETKFLIQDIDEHDSPETIDPKPSYIWESSPDKYQGMWELDRYIEQELYDQINPALANHISDTSECTDLVHVYRIPGTTNHKYKNKPKVELPEKSKKIYKPKNLKKLLKVTNKKKEDKIELGNISDITERKIYAKYNIPKKVRDILAMDSLDGIDRSNTIWYVENKLAEIGLEANEIIHLVKNSIFNKYKGRPDEDKRLRKELDKILSGKIEKKLEEEQPFQFKVDTFEDVMKNQAAAPGWLIRDFWGKRSHGIVAGVPKTMKSTLVHDLVVSVASGKPFLGKYEVEDPGPVIVIQNENSDYIMKDRTEKMMVAKGIGGKAKVTKKGKLKLTFPDNLPIYFINQQGFSMSEESHRKAVEDLIKKVKPVLVVFDPLYLMFAGDLNSAKELQPTLAWLMKLKADYRTSVMVIHHYNKGTGGGSTGGGQRMMGSITLYGWIESAWYLERDEEKNKGEAAVITMKREFRFDKPQALLDITVKMGGMVNPQDMDAVQTYSAEVKELGEDGEEPARDLTHELTNIILTSTKPLSKRKLADMLNLTIPQIAPTLQNLKDNGTIRDNKKGYFIDKEE